MKHQQAHEAESGEAPDLQILADGLVQAVGLSSAPVAVFLLAPDTDMAQGPAMIGVMPWFAGATRQEVDWGPTIDPKKCVSCGLCLNCGNLCQGHAISFPPLDELRKSYRDHHVWTQVKEAMIAAGKIPAGS